MKNTFYTLLITLISPLLVLEGCMGSQGVHHTSTHTHSEEVSHVDHRLPNSTQPPLSDPHDQGARHTYDSSNLQEFITFFILGALMAICKDLSLRHFRPNHPKKNNTYSRCKERIDYAMESYQ